MYTLMKKRLPDSSYRYFPVRVILGRASAAPAKKRERKDALILVVVVVVEMVGFKVLGTCY